MRKSFNGLPGFVRSGPGRDPASGEVFEFLNRCHSLLKLLHWEAGGYLYMTVEVNAQPVDIKLEIALLNLGKLRLVAT